LCNKNIGAEDYIKIAEACDHILIENIPAFKENNSNQQQRFITLIDIAYEKKIKLTISSELDLKSLTHQRIYLPHLRELQVDFTNSRLIILINETRVL